MSLMMVTEMFYSTPLTVDGLELPPLPCNVPRPDTSDSHHFDSLLASPKNQWLPNGTRRIDPFDVLYVCGDPYDLIDAVIYILYKRLKQLLSPVMILKRKKCMKR